MAEDESNANPPKQRRAGVVPDLLALIGFASLVYGCWLIYPAAGYIVGGGLGLITAVLMARGS